MGLVSFDLGFLFMGEVVGSFVFLVEMILFDLFIVRVILFVRNVVFYIVNRGWLLEFFEFLYLFIEVIVGSYCE